MNTDHIDVRAVASYRGLLRLSAPLMLGMAINSVMHFTDRLFLSWLSEDALAASLPVGITAFQFQTFFIACALYVSTFAAQHHGADEDEEAGAMVWPALWLAVIGGALLLAVVPFLRPIFALVNPSPAVEAAMLTLSPYLFAYTGPLIALTAINSFFTGLGRTTLMLALNTIVCCLNAGLNYVLVFGKFGIPAQGVAGSGMATLIATSITCGIAMAVFLSPENRRRYGTWRHARFDLERMRRFLRYSIPQGVRSFLEIITWTFFFFAVGRLGTAALAANNIVISWNMLSFFPMIGLSQGIAVVVGQCIGAGHADIARTATHRGLLLQLGYALTIGIVVVVAPDLLMRPFISPDQTIDRELLMLGKQLLLVSAFWGIGDAFNLAYTGALNGAGDTRWQLFAMLTTSVLLMALPIGAILILSDGLWRPFGLHPAVVLWLTTLAFVYSLGLVMGWRFYGGKWQRMTVRE